VGLGFIALLVWLVPMLFLARKQAEFVSSVAAPVGSAGGAAGGGGAIGKANDIQAQALLSSAISGAQVWYAENGTYTGFGPEQAAQYEPSVTYTSGAAAPGTVSLRVTPDAVVMVTVAKGGAPICVAALQDVVSRGRADASTSQQCQGGW
jgi:hypothetical protein